MPGISEAYLQANLAALAPKNPQLCQQLSVEPPPSGVQLSNAASGALTLCLKESGNVFLHSPADPVREAEEAADGFLAGHRGPVLLLGLGLGYYLEAVLKRINPAAPVFAYERDPGLFRLTFMRCDFSRDISSGRLHFLSGADIVYLGKGLRETEGLAVWPHPVLGPRYDWEMHALAGPPAAGPGAGTACRRAAVIAGGLFVEDVKEALQEMGVEVLSRDLSGACLEDDVQALYRFGPDLVFAVNYRHGLSEICAALGVPLIIWEVDPTVERLPPARDRYPHAHIFTYRKSHVARYREAGFAHVEYMPLATNPRRRRPLDLAASARLAYGADVSFVGSSMAGQAENLARLYASLTRNLHRRPHGTASGAPAPDYRALWSLALERQEESPDEYVIGDLFARGGIVPEENGRLVDLSDCAGEIAASRRRVRILESLSPLAIARGCTVKVWGDEGWRSRLPEGIEYSREAGHYIELTTIYNASKINLDIGRIYQRDIVTMRVFDILACKGFALVDAGGDLEDLFTPGADLASYRSISQIPSLVEYYLSHDAERLEMAECGYRKVLREHTIRKRVEGMLQSVV